MSLWNDTKGSNALSFSQNWKQLQEKLEQEKLSAAPVVTITQRKKKNKKTRKVTDTRKQDEQTTEAKSTVVERVTKKKKKPFADVSSIVAAESSTANQPSWTLVEARRKSLPPPSTMTAAVASTSAPTIADSDFDITKLRFTRALAIDCEYVGVGADGAENMLARVSIVNERAECIYDKYVLPTQKVIDYRTAVSGIRRHYTDTGVAFDVVRKEVQEIICDRILVGHEIIRSDLKVLTLKHDRRLCRDSARFSHFRDVYRKERGSKLTPSLKILAELFLGLKVQRGEHDSVADARTSMALYNTFKKRWDKEIRDTCTGNLRNPKKAQKRRAIL